MQKVWERSIDEQLTPDAWASIWKNKTKITNSVRITSSLTSYYRRSNLYCLYGILFILMFVRDYRVHTPIKTSGSQALVLDSLKLQMQESMALLLSWHVYIKWPGTWCVDFLECLYEAYECVCFQPQDHCEWTHADNKNPSDTRTKFSFFGLRECGCVLSLLLCLYVFILQSFLLGNVRLLACACRATSNIEWENTPL